MYFTFDRLIIYVNNLNYHNIKFVEIKYQYSFSPSKNDTKQVDESLSRKYNCFQDI